MHDVGSHAHKPVVLLHSWPVPHAAQLAPAVPHEMVDSDAHATHVPVESQQPCGHELASHTQLPVVLHSCPVGQALHATPPVPHDVADSPESGSHTPLLQQPAHAPPPHVHMPALHAPPVEHMPQATPPVPHSDEDCEP